MSHNGPRGSTLPPFDTPIVLMTRPRVASQEFLAALTPVAGAFEPHVCPAFELVPTNAEIPDFDAAIFTSRAGVSFAPNGRGRTAYCVGDATARAAKQAGYSAISAGGSSDDLCALILRTAPLEKLLHMRAVVSTGDVTPTLVSGGLKCSQVVIYRKEVTAIDPTELDVIRGRNTILIPVFSAETVSILRGWDFDFSKCHMIAISRAVADAAHELSPASVVMSDHPNLSSMVAATARLIA